MASRENPYSQQSPEDQITIALSDIAHVSPPLSPSPELIKPKKSQGIVRSSTKGKHRRRKRQSKNMEAVTLDEIERKIMAEELHANPSQEDLLEPSPVQTPSANDEWM